MIPRISALLYRHPTCDFYFQVFCPHNGSAVLLGLVKPTQTRLHIFLVFDFGPVEMYQILHRNPNVVTRFRTAAPFWGQTT